MSSNENEDEQFRRVFHGECDIRNRCLDIINNIKNNCNYPGNYLTIDSNNDHLTNLAWKLLGGYIANNTYLSEVTIDGLELNNVNMCTLFETLVRSSSLRILFLVNNSIDIEGVRSIVPFLENSPELITLSISGNTNINTECFEMVTSALHNRGMRRLVFEDCNITDVSALVTYNLPNLNNLSLNGNNISRSGCITLSNVLQKEGSTLKYLHLDSTGIGDEEAELVATALKHNTSLKEMHLSNNNGITERGYVAFLKLLNDVSSLESTYTSNHKLTRLRFTSNSEARQIANCISDALVKNKVTLPNYNPGRAKVIGSHLNSQTLKKLCNLQGIEYSYSNIFADVEPVLLPKILALIGDWHGHSEFYTALIQTAPDLMSYIDRKALIRDVIAKNTVRAAALATEYEHKVAALKTEFLGQTAHITAENNGLINRLALIELGYSRQSATGECNGDKREIGGSGGDKKRRRERNKE